MAMSLEKYLIGHENEELVVPVVRSENIIGNQLNLKEGKLISKNKFNSLSHGRLRRNDIIFKLRGAIGSAVFDCEHECGITSGNFLIIRAEQIDPYYLHRFLTMQVIEDHFSRIKKGSLTGYLTRDQVENLNVTILR